MRLLVLAFLVALFSAGAALAQDSGLPREGQVYQRLQADLDRDGQAETVSLVAYNVTEEGWFGQLVVTRRDGSRVWAGPRPTDPQDPMAFGGWDWGVAGLEVAGDLDGDGRIEVLGALPQSDVSPATFRVLRWNGREFRRAFARSLLESPRGSGRYPWAKAPQQIDGLRWVMSFESTGKAGTCLARVYEVSGAATRLGTASMVADRKGFHVVRWIEPLR